MTSSYKCIPIILLLSLYLTVKLLNSSMIWNSENAFCMTPNAIVIRVTVHGVNARLMLASISSSSKNKGRYPIQSSLFKLLSNLACSEFSAKVKMLLQLLSQFLIISAVVCKSTDSISSILSFNQASSSSYPFI